MSPAERGIRPPLQGQKRICVWRRSVWYYIGTLSVVAGPKPAFGGPLTAFSIG